MKTFNQFLEEAYGAGKKGWKPTKGTEEHDEIGYQLKAHKEGIAPVHPSIAKAMEHLSDPKNYARALQKSKIRIYNRQKLKHVENTTGGEGWVSGRKQLNKGKVDRADKQASEQEKGKRKLPMPVIIRAKNKKTGETVEHNVSGNTRLSRHGGKGVPAQVIHFEHD